MKRQRDDWGRSQDLLKWKKEAISANMQAHICHGSVAVGGVEVDGWGLGAELWGKKQEKRKDPSVHIVSDKEKVRTETDEEEEEGKH